MNIDFNYKGKTHRMHEWERLEISTHFHYLLNELYKIFPQEVISIISDAGYFILIDGDKPELSFVIKALIEQV
jgi:hypothetical protein